MKIKLAPDDLEPLITAIKDRMLVLARQPDSLERNAEISALQRVAKGAGVTLRVVPQSNGEPGITRGETI